jgi:hypothetical protein
LGLRSKHGCSESSDSATAQKSVFICSANGSILCDGKDFPLTGFGLNGLEEVLLPLFDPCSSVVPIEPFGCG